METNKVIGYILVLVGLLVIVFSGISAYRVFTGRSEAVSLFTANSITIDITQLMGEEAQPENAIRQNGMPPANLELLNQELINTFLNSIFHLILMFFMVFLGSKVASIGVMLVRPIKVKLATDKK